MKKIVQTVILWGLILAVVFLVLEWRKGYTEHLEVMAPVPFIVIDSGHGFFDAGKTGINGAVEKEINLAIAKKLRSNLVQQGYEVRMTREDDETLYDGSCPDTKQEDMKKRVALMNDSGCLLAVSIHQNSFTAEKYKGAQVFYYTGSEESQRLAASIQQSFLELLDDTNTRKEKANSDYYLLKKTIVPAVICECGFLSNSEEAALLVTDEYQEKAAWAITVGILRYLNNSTEMQADTVSTGDIIMN
ncbi:MAG: N-acetylmuramoyl-L-alanine amidase [Coprococcus sp.]